MPPQPQPSLKELAAKAVADAKRLATAQMALAKVEMSETGQRIGKGGALGVATLGIVIFAILFLLVTLALVFVALGLPAWAGFLIVAVLLIIVGTITGLLARKEFNEIKPASLAMAEFEKTKAALSGQPLPSVVEAPSIDVPKTTGP